MSVALRHGMMNRTVLVAILGAAVVGCVDDKADGVEASDDKADGSRSQIKSRKLVEEMIDVTIDSANLTSDCKMRTTVEVNADGYAHIELVKGDKTKVIHLKNQYANVNVAATGTSSSTKVAYKMTDSRSITISRWEDISNFEVVLKDASGEMKCSFDE